MAKEPIVLSFGLTAEVKFYSSLLMKKMKYDQTIRMPVFHNLLKVFTGSSKVAEGLKGRLSLQDFQKQAVRKKRKAFDVSTSYKHQKIPPAIPTAINKITGDKFLDVLPKSTDCYLQKGCGAFPLRPSQGQQDPKAALASPPRGHPAAPLPAPGHGHPVQSQM